jgi:hypothetical protein
VRNTQTALARLRSATGRRCRADQPSRSRVDRRAENALKGFDGALIAISHARQRNDAKAKS